jgi:hypothetical protein
VIAAQQQRRELAATARALETLAAGMAEAGGAGDFDNVAINAFRASLAVLSLRGMADRMALVAAEQERVRGIVERAAAATHPLLVSRGPQSVLEAFDWFFPTARLEDLNVERATALDLFINALAARS